MTRKVRQLIAPLERAGFVTRGDEGFRRDIRHPQRLRLTACGHPGDDTEPYQEWGVRRALPALNARI